MRCRYISQFLKVKFVQMVNRNGPQPTIKTNSKNGTIILENQIYINFIYKLQQYSSVAM